MTVPVVVAGPSRRMRRGWIAVLLATIVAAGCTAPVSDQTQRPAVTDSGTAPGSPDVTGHTAPATTHASEASPSSTSVAATTPAPSGRATPTAVPGTVRPTGSAVPSEPLPRVSLVVGGDVMLGRTIGERLEAEGPEVAFEAVAPILAGADIALVNLECTISERGRPEPKAYVFGAPRVAIDALVGAGVDVVSQANNHALDRGAPALLDTLGSLDLAGIRAFGAGATEADAHRPVIVERNGVRVAFVGFMDVPVEVRGFDTRRWIARGPDPGVAWAEPEVIRADVAAAAANADVVVAYFHFGFEGSGSPSDRQRRQARAAVDAGADLVLGAHPHVLQGTERYRGALIAYSLGNFVFDGFTAPSHDSALLHVDLGHDGVVDFRWTPVVIEDGLPRLAGADEATRILRRVRPIP